VKELLRSHVLVHSQPLKKPEKFHHKQAASKEYNRYTRHRHFGF
jgi:hypothetical protein